MKTLDKVSGPNKASPEGLEGLPTTLTTPTEHLMCVI